MTHSARPINLVIPVTLMILSAHLVLLGTYSLKTIGIQRTAKAPDGFEPSAHFPVRGDAQNAKGTEWLQILGVSLRFVYLPQCKRSVLFCYMCPS